MAVDENIKVVIAAEVNPSVKKAFEKWWRANNYATESEAVRALVRDKIQEQEAEG